MQSFLPKTWQPAAIIIVAALLLFWRMDTRGLNEWDEARNGVNAYEMYHNGDCINLYYAGEPDTWNAKPPLMTWLIAGSYRLFGFNAFALRFPAALAVLGFFIYALKLGRRTGDGPRIMLTCLILLSCKAVLGIHTGLTADFDALLLFLLLAAAYYFCCYIDFGEQGAIYATALFTGVAFYAKGPAALVYIPGYILYGSIRSGGLRWLKDYRIWVAVLLVLLITGSWVLLVILYGHAAGPAHYGSRNAIETMVVYDTWQRLTSSGFEGGQAADYLFFVKVLDVRFNLWNYLFYAAMAAGIYQMAHRGKEAFGALKSAENRLLLYSICMALPPALLLTFARYKYVWYLAPAFLFIAYMIAAGLLHFMRLWKGAGIVCMLLLIFSIARHAYYMDSLKSETGKHVNSHAAYFQNDRDIVTIGSIRQDMFLYLEWTGKKILPIQQTALDAHSGAILAIDTTLLTPGIAAGLQCPWNEQGYRFGMIR